VRVTFVCLPLHVVYLRFVYLHSASHIAPHLFSCYCYGERSNTTFTITTLYIRCDPVTPRLRCCCCVHLPAVHIWAFDLRFTRYVTVGYTFILRLNFTRYGTRLLRYLRCYVRYVTVVVDVTTPRVTCCYRTTVWLLPHALRSLFCVVRYLRLHFARYVFPSVVCVTFPTRNVVRLRTRYVGRCYARAIYHTATPHTFAHRS